MTKTFKIIDTKTNKVAFRNVSEREAHQRVDLLNSSGVIRFKAQAI